LLWSIYALKFALAARLQVACWTTSGDSISRKRSRGGLFAARQDRTFGYQRSGGIAAKTANSIRASFGAKDFCWVSCNVSAGRNSVSDIRYRSFAKKTKETDERNGG